LFFQFPQPHVCSRQEVLELVFKAVTEKTSRDALEQEIIDGFEEYVKIGQS
jgi:hypothetical protein